MNIILKNLKLVAPWLFACGIFVYLFHKYPPQQVWKSMTYVNLLPFTLFCAGYFFAIFLVDSAVTKYVICRFTRHVPFKDVFLARGVTYLIMVISYPASQASFGYYFKRQFGIPIFKILSSFIFIMLIDLWWVVTYALIGSFFQEYTIAGLDLSRVVFISVIVVYGTYFLWIAFWRRWPSHKFWSAVTPGFIEKQRRRNIFHVFAHAKLMDYVKVTIMRMPIHFTIIVSMYIVVRTFNCHIPFAQVMGNIPLVFLIGTLPITPGGLGTTNAVMVELLKGHLTGSIFDAGVISPAELLFSATLLWMFGNYFLKVLTGMVFMAFVPKKLFEPTANEPEEKVEKEALHIGGNL